MLLNLADRFPPSEAIHFETVLLLKAAHHRHGERTVDSVLLQRRRRAEFVSDNARYAAYDVTVDEANIVGRIRWFCREL
jgi:hypothetical protein